MDGASDIFYRVWNFIVTSHANDHHFRGLLYHTARYWLGDYHRKANRTVSFEELQDQGETIVETKEGAETIVARADASVVRKLVDKLKPEQAEIIALKYFQGMEIGDIAKRIEKSENATRVALHRALKELRNYL